MSRHEFLLFSIAFVILFGVIYYFTQCTNGVCGPKPVNAADPKSFVECVRSGGEVKNEKPRKCIAKNGVVFVDEVKGSSSSSYNVKITVSEPKADATVGLPFVVKGMAVSYEGQINYRLLDVDGAVLAEGNTVVSNAKSDSPSDFTFSVNYTEPFGTKGTLEVFEYSPADGKPMGTVTIPVAFKKVETREVNVYFMNLKEDPDRLHCDVTTAFKRRIPVSESVEKDALAQLLLGPTLKENKNGAQTALPSGVTIQSFAIKGSTATVDFNEALQKDVGGSCRVTAIRAQIENTLKQFPTVKKVVITSNGSKPGETLQP